MITNVQYLITNLTRGVGKSFSECDFSIVSLILLCVYSLLFIWSVWYLWGIFHVPRRKTQKFVLVTIILIALVRLSFFIAWMVKIISDGKCTPGEMRSHHWIAEVLGSIPVCLFFTMFSLYLVSFSRIHRIFQLQYLRWPPKRIIRFHDFLSLFLIAFNVVIYICCFIQIPISIINRDGNNHTHNRIYDTATLVTMVSAGVGMAVVSLLFTIVSKSMANTIDEFLYIEHIRNHDDDSQPQDPATTAKDGEENSSFTSYSSFSLPQSTSFSNTGEERSQNGPRADDSLQTPLLSSPSTDQFHTTSSDSSLREAASRGLGSESRHSQPQVKAAHGLNNHYNYKSSINYKPSYSQSSVPVSDRDSEFVEGFDSKQGDSQSNRVTQFFSSIGNFFTHENDPILSDQEILFNDEQFGGRKSHFFNFNFQGLKGLFSTIPQPPSQMKMFRYHADSIRLTTHLPLDYELNNSFTSSLPAQTGAKERDNFQHVARIKGTLVNNPNSNSDSTSRPPTLSSILTNSRTSRRSLFSGLKLSMQRAHFIQTHLDAGRSTDVADSSDSGDSYNLTNIVSHAENDVYFSYGIRGRLSLNPHKNPMTKVFLVSLLLLAIMCVRLFVITLGNYIFNVGRISYVYLIYYCVGEVIPIILLLSLFHIVIAPSLQWNATYGLDNPDLDIEAFALSMYEDYKLKVLEKQRQEEEDGRLKKLDYRIDFECADTPDPSYQYDLEAGEGGSPVNNVSSSVSSSRGVEMPSYSSYNLQADSISADTIPIPLPSPPPDALLPPAGSYRSTPLSSSFKQNLDKLLVGSMGDKFIYSSYSHSSVHAPHGTPNDNRDPYVADSTSKSGSSTLFKSEEPGLDEETGINSGSSSRRSREVLPVDDVALASGIHSDFDVRMDELASSEKPPHSDASFEVDSESVSSLPLPTSSSQPPLPLPIAIPLPQPNRTNNHNPSSNHNPPSASPYSSPHKGRHDSPFRARLTGSVIPSPAFGSVSNSSNIASPNPVVGSTQNSNMPSFSRIERVDSFSFQRDARNNKASSKTLTSPTNVGPGDSRSRPSTRTNPSNHVRTGSRPRKVVVGIDDLMLDSNILLGNNNGFNSSNFLNDDDDDL